MDDREQTGGPGPGEIDAGGRQAPSDPSHSADREGPARPPSGDSPVSGGEAAEPPSHPGEPPSVVGEAGKPPAVLTAPEVSDTTRSGQPALSETCPIADGEDHHVDPRSILVVRLIAIPMVLVIAVPQLVVLTLLWALGPLPFVAYVPLVFILLGIVGVALTFAYAFPSVRHRYLRYRVDPAGLRIQRGVLWRKTTWIPITRVQHTDVSQGPLQRRFDLATLIVNTAGTENATIPLSGLEHGVATRLSDHLRPDRKRDAH